MSLPRVIAVAPGSPAALAGISPGDELARMNGQVPRDVIEYQVLVDEALIEIELSRGGLDLEVTVEKDAGEPLGIEVDSPVFDQVRTCDNHCEFCFIYQLPEGMRKSLYVKDDDYRLSFLYGNFTTLTRFTEADLERVITERLSPLYVSIHATDPEMRAHMLRNRRGATSLRWLRALLDHGIEVHGQLVICPGENDGAILESTLAGIVDEYPELVSVGAVPLGVSRYTKEGAMRPHTTAEAYQVLDTIEQWQEIALAALGRRLVFAADEYYLLAKRPFPEADAYEDYPQHENGIGMARMLEAEIAGLAAGGGHTGGFFASLEGAPATGYRATRCGEEHDATVQLRRRVTGPTTVLTGEYGAAVLEPLLDRMPGGSSVRVLPIANDFFGGNIGVTGLLTGADIARVLSDETPNQRFLLPDVCLSNGRFLDGMALEELPRAVEVVPTNGAALRAALSRSAA